MGVFHSVRPESAAVLVDHLTPESACSPQAGIFALTIIGPGTKSKISVINSDGQAVFKDTMLEDRPKLGTLDLLCLHRYILLYVQSRQNSDLKLYSTTYLLYHKQK